MSRSAWHARIVCGKVVGAGFLVSARRVRGHVPPAACLVIGTTAAEEEAARTAGAFYLPRALRPLLDAAREL
ncbi:MAG TPA: hypothetical protein VK545_26200 [Streptomyces sp.]|nr:hypothetical protein [Streptomyces sp.]